MSHAEVGTRRPRVDAREQVTGKVEYTGDLYLPGMLYAKPLLSTEHHARILELDTSAAERLPGVKAVATAKDAPDNINGLIIPDQPVFADDKVRYCGEIVALVAAETEEIAQQAVELIRVKYERLPAVFDPREAMKPEAPVIHEEGQGKWCKGNQVLPHGHDHMLLLHGDVEKAFAESDLIVEHSFGTSAQRCVPIEPHACIAKPEGPDRVTIIGNTQMPFWHQPAIAKALKLPFNRVRVSVPPMGGGFGQKNNITIEPNVAILAMKAGRPVRWALTTYEDFRYSSTKIPVYHTYKMGLKSDGTLLAVHRKHIGNTGAYASTAMITMGKCTMIGSGPYRIPNQLAETWVVYTNKCQSAAFRGFGMSQPTFAVELMMDIIAEKLGMDPLELRMKNIMKDGDRAGTGQAMRSVGIKACLDKVAELSGWEVTSTR
ncbi:MAG: xanthine dehydrogenase family protein molybdopterin-binding subunit [bacterium]